LLQDIVPWRSSRKVLYWRLKRLLLEEQVKTQLESVQPELGPGQTEAMLRRWFVEDRGQSQVKYSIVNFGACAVRYTHFGACADQEFMVFWSALNEFQQLRSTRMRSRLLRIIIYDC
jgi:hypothetical protein